MMGIDRGCVTMSAWQNREQMGVVMSGRLVRVWGWVAELDGLLDDGREPSQGVDPDAGLAARRVRLERVVRLRRRGVVYRGLWE